MEEKVDEHEAQEEVENDDDDDGGGDDDDDDGDGDGDGDGDNDCDDDGDGDGGVVVDNGALKCFATDHDTHLNQSQPFASKSFTKHQRSQRTLKSNALNPSYILKIHHFCNVSLK